MGFPLHESLYTFIVQKTDDATRTTRIEANSVEVTKGGVLTFYAGNRIVMAYPPHAWESFYQELPSEK